MTGVHEPQWDGSRWTMWDGSRWLVATDDGQWAPAPPPPPAPVVAVDPPTGAPPAPAPVAAGRPEPTSIEVFGQVYWRTLVVSLLGGLVIGTGLGVVLLIADATNDNVRLPLAYVWAGAIFGLIFGVILGFWAGFLTGGLASARLVPYPGAAAARRFMTIVALAVVLVFDVAMAVVIRPTNVSAALFTLGLAVAALVGAWFSGRWLVRWYGLRMDASGVAA